MQQLGYFPMREHYDCSGVVENGHAADDPVVHPAPSARATEVPAHRVLSILVRSSSVQKSTRCRVVRTAWVRRGESRSLPVAELSEPLAQIVEMVGSGSLVGGRGRMGQFQLRLVSHRS